MKRKQKWAKERCNIVLEDFHYRSEKEPTHYEDCWIDGYEYALKLCGVNLQEWEGCGLNSFLTLGEEEE